MVNSIAGSQDDTKRQAVDDKQINYTGVSLLVLGTTLACTLRLMFFRVVIDGQHDHSVMMALNRDSAAT